MTRELFVASDRPVDVVDVLSAGVANGRDLGIRTLWGGGAMQLVDDAGDALVTVLRSIVVTESADLRRWGWRGDIPPRYLTEAYVADTDDAQEVAAAVWRSVGGTPMGPEREGIR